MEEANTETITWADVLAGEKELDYFKGIMQFLQEQRRAGKTVYPAKEDIFNAIKFTPYADVKVVIIGQDPYHGPNQAHGLSFSVRHGITPPPSLKNIFKELHEDLGIEIPSHGCLEGWAKQGVLLLNAVLTVEAGQPSSHANVGWQHFTDRIIEVLNDHPQRIVYLLWGAYAQRKGQLIDDKHHHVLTAAHPSPFSAHNGFFGCRHFSQANNFLKEHHRGEIDWNLE